MLFPSENDLKRGMRTPAQGFVLSAAPTFDVIQGSNESILRANKHYTPGFNWRAHRYLPFFGTSSLLSVPGIREGLLVLAAIALQQLFGAVL